MTERPAGLDDLLNHVADNLPTEPGTVPPDVVSAILRDPDSPYFPCQMTVYCDTCGHKATGDYLVREDMTKPERLAVARQHLTQYKGWRTDDTGDYCPAHAAP